MITRRRALAAGAAFAAALTPRIAAGASTPKIEVRPDLASLFAAHNVTGAFATQDAAGGAIVASEEARVATPYLPASTYKIPHSLIALETGIAQDADHPVFKWDGVRREFEAWNRDHTLCTAFKASSVPTFQAIARQVGRERMQSSVDAFDYGNRDIGGGIDRFWLDGNLRTSILQQLAFLGRLARDELPVRAQHQAVVRDCMLIEQSESGTLRGKTGAVGIGTAEGSKASLGWLVGWLERRGRTHLFALNVDVSGPEQLAVRLPLAKALLERAIVG